MRDRAVAVLEEDQHLVISVIDAERLAMVEHGRLSGPGTSVLIEQLYAISCGDPCHGDALSGKESDRQGRRCVCRLKPITGDQKGAENASESVAKTEISYQKSRAFATREQCG
jgi:hypothetical protein